MREPANALAANAPASSSPEHNAAWTPSPAERSLRRVAWWHTRVMRRSESAPLRAATASRSSVARTDGLRAARVTFCAAEMRPLAAAVSQGNVERSGYLVPVPGARRAPGRIGRECVSHRFPVVDSLRSVANYGATHCQNDSDNHCDHRDRKNGSIEGKHAARRGTVVVIAGTPRLEYIDDRHNETSHREYRAEDHHGRERPFRFHLPSLWVYEN